MWAGWRQVRDDVEYGAARRKKKRKITEELHGFLFNNVKYDLQRVGVKTDDSNS